MYGSAGSLMFQNKGQILNYGELEVQDAKGKTLPAHFTVQQNQLEIAVDAGQVAYPVSGVGKYLNLQEKNVSAGIHHSKNFIFEISHEHGHSYMDLSGWYNFCPSIGSLESTITRFSLARYCINFP